MIVIPSPSPKLYAFSRTEVTCICFPIDSNSMAYNSSASISSLTRQSLPTELLEGLPSNIMAVESMEEHDQIFMANPKDMLNPASINPAFIPIIVTHSITFMIGVVGNIAVILTWAQKGKLRSPTASFLVSLAVADLLMLLLYFPLETLEYFVITWDESGSICKLSSYFEMLSGMASVLNLVAVSVERLVPRF